ncbi:MAG: Cytochrome c oxidase polypeptide III, partial [uncultured Rubellimicrobium sp.]
GTQRQAARGGHRHDRPRMGRHPGVEQPHAPLVGVDLLRHDRLGRGLYARLSGLAAGERGHLGPSGVFDPGGRGGGHRVRGDGAGGDHGAAGQCRPRAAAQRPGASCLCGGCGGFGVPGELRDLPRGGRERGAGGGLSVAAGRR